MPQLVIVAQLDAKPGKERELEAALRSLVVPTRADEGCERYQLHQSTTEPGHFQFHEQWTSRELWQTHMASPHLQAFNARTDELVASWRLFELQAID